MISLSIYESLLYLQSLHHKCSLQPHQASEIKLCTFSPQYLVNITSENVESVLICSGFHNEMPQMRYLEQQRFVFSVLEAISPRLGVS